MSPRRLLLGLTAALLCAAGASVPAAQAAGKWELRTARHYQALRDDPVKLRAFLAAMPKGGDLHNHLSGAVPTETLIALAVQDGLCIDVVTLTATPAPAAAGAACPAGQRAAAESATDTAFYGQILRAWSMEGFVAGAETGHDHFFATFGKFGLATSRKGDMLAVVARINAAQNVLYLETLVSRQGDAVRALAKSVGFDPDFQACTAGCWNAAWRRSYGGERRDRRRRRSASTSCWAAAPRGRTRPARWSLRYDYQVGRATDPEIVFTNLVLGFELQRSDRRYVGVNLVQPEDNPVALRDYTLHMRMIRYLRDVYAGHVTLHAGEIVPGLVSPADLRFHIRQAVEIAGAERIGHGVDLTGETGYRSLLRTMARRHVLVEAPLTSNAQILGVSGRAHPFLRYRAAGVPLALATDDPGVSRIDLTHEYAFAATEYDLGYRSLKELARASLEHAFLPGPSLWRAVGQRRRRAVCAADVPGEGPPGRRCSAFLRRSAKATVQWRQEQRSYAFEHRRR